MKPEDEKIWNTGNNELKIHEPLTKPPQTGHPRHVASLATAPVA